VTGDVAGDAEAEGLAQVVEPQLHRRHSRDRRRVSESQAPAAYPPRMADTSDKIFKTDEQWRQELSPEAYGVLRQGGTERAFTGRYADSHEDGLFRCGGCGAELFSSATKFESGSGWPSFTEPADRAHVTLIEDRTHGMVRTEVRCARCDGHLGHVFDDGPRDAGGMRYCINSAALTLDPGAGT